MASMITTMEGLVDFGDKVYKGWVMIDENTALEPDYHLRKSVAFFGRWLVFGLGSLRRRGGGGGCVGVGTLTALAKLLRELVVSSLRF
jgi:hypothetical protein